MYEIKCSPGACSNMRVRGLVFNFYLCSYIAVVQGLGHYKMNKHGKYYYAWFYAENNPRPEKLSEWASALNEEESFNGLAAHCQLDYVKRIGKHLELVTYSDQFVNRYYHERY